MENEYPAERREQMLCQHLLKASDLLESALAKPEAHNDWEASHEH